jgi:hypothetical protein
LFVYIEEGWVSRWGGGGWFSVDKKMRKKRVWIITFHRKWFFDNKKQKRGNGIENKWEEDALLSRESSYSVHAYSSLYFWMDDSNLTHQS